MFCYNNVLMFSPMGGKERTSVYLVGLSLIHIFALGYMIMAIVADFVAGAGQYKSKKLNSLSYILFLSLIHILVIFKIS